MNKLFGLFFLFISIFSFQIFAQEEPTPDTFPAEIMTPPAETSATQDKDTGDFFLNKSWIYLGMGGGYSHVLTDVGGEVAKNGWQLDLKGLYSYAWENWMLDLGVGWFYNRLSGESGAVEEKITTLGGFFEASPLYRFTESWSFGPVARLLVGNDSSFGTQGAEDDITGLGGLQLMYAFPWDLPVRLAVAGLTDFTISDRQFILGLASIQIGLPLNIKPLAKKGAISGVVSDGATQTALSDVQVSLSGNSFGSKTTDAAGQFSFESLPDGLYNVDFEKPGYASIRRAVEMKKGADQILQISMYAQSASVYGSVKNEEGTPLVGTFICDEGKMPGFVSDPVTGQYRSEMSPGSHYCRVTSENYLPQDVTFEVAPGDNKEYVIIMKKPEKAELVGEQIILPDNIYFAVDSDKIASKSFPVLDQVAEILNANPKAGVLSIEGHTDSDGSDAYNQNLSVRRSASVKKYLVGKGTSEERLQSKGFGESEPIATNSTKEGKTENRRVEFHFLDPKTGEKVKPKMTVPAETPAATETLPTPEVAPAPAPAAPAPVPESAPVPSEEAMPMPESLPVPANP